MMPAARIRRSIVWETLWVLASLGVLSLVANWWVLHRDNFFGMDDFDWFNQLRHGTGRPGFTLLPAAPYNDRPIGKMFLGLLLDQFGWHHRAHHAVLWAVHLLNAGLVYLFTRRLLAMTETSQGSARFPAWLAAAIFVAWPTSTVAPSWDASVFDLLGGTFLMLFLVTAVAARERRLLAIQAPLMLVFLWIGLRTKEMLIVAPFTVVVIGLGVIVTERWKQRRGAVPGFAIVAAALCGVSVLYYVLLRLADTEGYGIEPSHPYFQSFSPAVLVSNAGRYLALFFDFGIPDNMATWPVGGRWLYYLVPVAVVATAVWQWRRRAGVTIALSVVTACMQLAPVLPMANMQQRLYLYLPSVFAAVALATTFAFLVDRLPVWQAIVRPVVALAVSGVMIWGVYGSSVWISRNWWLEIGHENSIVFPQLFQLPTFPESARIAVVNVPDYMLQVSLFSPGTGSGDALRAVGSAQSISVTIYEHEMPAGETKDPPTHVLDYNGGHLLLRSQTPANGR